MATSGLKCALATEMLSGDSERTCVRPCRGNGIMEEDENKGCLSYLPPQIRWSMSSGQLARILQLSLLLLRPRKADSNS